MDISSIVWVVIAFIVGYFVGVNATFNAIENDPSILDELEYQEYEEEIDNIKQISIYIEEDNGHLFVYESGTNKFMAHGKTRQEMEDVLTARFPNTIFAATEENLLQVRFI